MGCCRAKPAHRAVAGSAKPHDAVDADRKATADSPPPLTLPEERRTNSRTAVRHFQREKRRNILDPANRGGERKVREV